MVDVKMSVTTIERRAAFRYRLSQAAPVMRDAIKRAIYREGQNHLDVDARAASFARASAR
jgi:hypothetical protein